MLVKLVKLIIQMVEIYGFMLLAWVIGSWFPRFQMTKFYDFLDSAVAPFAKLFRGIIPPLGGLDFSIIVAFIVLQVGKDILAWVLLKLVSG